MAEFFDTEGPIESEKERKTRLKDLLKDLERDIEERQQHLLDTYKDQSVAPQNTLHHLTQTKLRYYIYMS